MVLKRQSLLETRLSCCPMSLVDDVDFFHLDLYLLNCSIYFVVWYDWSYKFNKGCIGINFDNGLLGLCYAGFSLSLFCENLSYIYCVTVCTNKCNLIEKTRNEKQTWETIRSDIRDL